jgi:hypothetical protein
LTELSESAKANVLDNVKIQSILDETLTDAIAATDISKGMNTIEAFKLAKKRGYSGNDKSFRDRFEKSGYGETFGLRRIPHKQGRENWLYFDTQTHT